MNPSNNTRPPTRRAPLGDATVRVNNINPSEPLPSHETNHPQMVHHESHKHGGQMPLNDSVTSPYSKAQAYGSYDQHELHNSPGATAPNPRLSAISKENQVRQPNRYSQISTTSTNASDSKGRRKTHIGPWHLGKTLGKGATARVRMARHAITGQPAAIKIVQKKTAQISQAGSLASLDRKDAEFKDGEGVRRMPYGIEREVAIMKLIEHPHIMQLYDIWENRTEIYLVLEYVDNGELFDHISHSGYLPEEEAIKYFRQLLSAVGYCHQFNICHRDLKPENILLTRDNDIKIADFGMAALQQHPEHRLVTSCGSPHYAAPEVIRAVPYRGDKVDIWSMGVILYATLSGRLPFDNPSLPRLLAEIQKGHYRMASIIRPDAADLIRRMLQVDPRDRLSINQIWRHPLVRKYDYLDDYKGGLNPKLPSFRDYGRPVARRSDIDRELLRHLKSLWHQFEEQELIDLLLNDKQNDQKLFYSLLLKHREHQLENYTPDVGYSNSDYHHVRPLAQVKKLSTRQFSQQSSRGHKRQVSRFTVVSNGGVSRHGSKSGQYAGSEAAETVQSYDPFKASRQHALAASTADGQANVTIHRNVATILQEEKGALRKGASTASSKRSGRQSSLNPPRKYATRSSLASSTRSRGSNGKARVGLRHKRGVSFPHNQRHGSRATSESAAVDRTREYAANNEERTPPIPATSNSPLGSPYIRSKKAPATVSQPLLSLQNPEGSTRLFQDDVRKLSNSLAQDCDEAFNRFSALSTVASSFETRSGNRSSTPFSSFDQQDINSGQSVQTAKSKIPKPNTAALGSAYDTRPLPPPPARSESVNVQLVEARKRAENQQLAPDVTHSSRYLNRMASHIDRLMQPQDEREIRVASAPYPSRLADHTGSAVRVEPFNTKLSDHNDDYDQFVRCEQARVAHRVGSAPEPRTARDDIVARDLPELTIRHVDGRAARVISPSPYQTKPQTPTYARNISARTQESSESVVTTGTIRQEMHLAPELDLEQCSSHNSRETYRPDSGYAEESTTTDAKNSIVRKKKSSWFKRNSKFSEEKEQDRVLQERPSNVPTIRAPEPKKKSFALSNLFKKRGGKDDDNETFGSFELHDDEPPNSEHQPYYQGGARLSRTISITRQIEPQQNWLARLFNVKPAKKYMCFALSKRRARQEVVALLKDWRQYGIKDIVVDKKRNIVFGKVGSKNYLHLKEVSFACEIMTVIEHGKRNYLSIARFTQETGAASSFHKVVETMQTVFTTRGFLVADERKSRMMIKTLTSA